MNEVIRITTRLNKAPAKWAYSATAVCVFDDNLPAKTGFGSGDTPGEASRQAFEEVRRALDTVHGMGG